MISEFEDCNFYMKDGNAYTLDGVLVYNFFIRSLPRSFIPQVTKETMEAYFGQFGKILEIRLFCTPDEREPTQSAFVCFEDAKSAAKVLENKSIFLDVKACDTWNQPLPRELFPPEIASPLGVYDKEFLRSYYFKVDTGPAVPPSIDGAKLTDLNSDCLEHILKFLDMRDQLNFARISQRFSGIVEMIYKIKYRVLDCRKLYILTLWEVRDFFILAGPYVEVLMGFPSSYSERIFEFIVKYGRDLQLDSMRKRLRKNELCEVDDPSLCLPNLEPLQLSDNLGLVGRNRKLFPKLKELNLSCHINREHFIAICAALTELRSLHISHGFSLDEGCIRQMVQHCAKLETVKMSICGHAVDVVGTLPHLKRFEINVEVDADGYLASSCHAIAEHRANQLEELVITNLFAFSLSTNAAQSIRKLKKLRLLKLQGWGVGNEALFYFHKLESLQHIELLACHYLTDGAVLRLLGNCKTIRYVKIIRPHSLSADFFASATEMLRSQGRQVKEEQEFVPQVNYVFSISDLLTQTRLPAFVELTMHYNGT